MLNPRMPARDPRTVSRDIPGIIDTVFPQLNSSLVGYYNQDCDTIDECKAVDDANIVKSSLSRAMLFELCVARGEELLSNRIEPDWEQNLRTAVNRQRKHFDATAPQKIDAIDKKIAIQIGQNLHIGLRIISSKNLNDVAISPKIPGYNWISNGVGDFSINDTLIEIKCTNKRFSASDYRQVMMYWILSYINAIEGNGFEWKNIVLFNPRKNIILELPFDDLIYSFGRWRSKIELVETFSSLVADGIGERF